MPSLTEQQATVLRGAFVVAGLISIAAGAPLLGIRFFGGTVFVTGWYWNQTRSIEHGWEGQPASGTLTGVWAGRLAVLAILIGAAISIWPGMLLKATSAP